MYTNFYKLAASHRSPSFFGGTFFLKTPRNRLNARKLATIVLFSKKHKEIIFWLDSATYEQIVSTEINDRNPSLWIMVPNTRCLIFLENYLWKLASDSYRPGVVYLKEMNVYLQHRSGKYMLLFKKL